MSEFFELVDRLCPEGVEWKLLGDIAEIGTGSSNANEGLEEGLYPFYVRSQKPLRKNEYEFDETAIITAGDGNVGKVFHYVEGKYALHQRAYRIHITLPKVMPKYYFYYMCSAFPSYIEKIMYQSSVASIRRSMLTDFPVPLPPLEVQREVVGILDLFTGLTAELTAELELRKKQYAYYREVLLSFDEKSPSVIKEMTKRLCSEGVEWKTLDEVFTIRNGYTPSKANPDYWEGGTIPWFRMDDIRTNGRILEDSIQHITPAGVKGKLFEKDSIILATTATIGEHALLMADALANQQFTNFAICKSLKERLLPKFAFYYFFMIDEWCKKNTRVSSFPSVDMKKLKKQPFPLPPLEIQHKIVEILDKFDTLTTSLTEGIPAEIEARRKQYTYYRNKLLTFKDLAPSPKE